MPSEVLQVPLRPLTEETAAGLGTVIRTLDEAEIEQVRWRPAGNRPVTSGGYGHVSEGPFDVYWKGELLFSENQAVGRSDLVGWRVDPEEASEDREPPDRDLVLVDEVNYHDDGGQAFMPPGTPTVFLLAPPGDDVAPDDFVALHSDGSVGVNMHPGVWHTTALPLAPSATYENRQGSIHATVALWARREFGALFEIPLRAP